MTKRIMLIAFEFPPSNGASIQRIVSVYKKFLKEGWIVDVLTSTPFSYPKIQKGSENDLPENVHGKIIKAFSLDALEQVGFKGKHIGALINPDRWGMTWYPSAIIMAAMHISKHKIDLVWSSAPIPTVHKLGKEIAARSGAKWIADYRDPLPYLHGESGSYLESPHKKIDLNVVENADLMTFSTEQVMGLYVDYYEGKMKKTVVIENGYDEDNMEDARQKLHGYYSSVFAQNTISFYYAGVLYADGRDPKFLFEALSEFKKENPEKAFELIFQGAGSGKDFASKIEALDLIKEVRFIDGVSLKEALCNMLSADVLVLIQDELFNKQVPGKLYEYLATNKTLLLKTPDYSATNNVAKLFDGVFCAQHKQSLLDNIRAIFHVIEQSKNHSPDWGRFPSVTKHSRKTQAQILFDEASKLCGVNG